MSKTTTGGKNVENTDKRNKALKAAEIKSKKKKSFKIEWKENLMNYNEEVKTAIIEDRDASDIINIMYKSIEEYVDKNIRNIDYENALERLPIYDKIPKDKLMNLYPDLESIERDFKLNTQQELQTYGNRWIDDCRLDTIFGKSLNSVIVTKLRGGSSLNQVLDHMSKKKPNIEDMPNLKNTLIKRIESELKKLQEQKQQGEQK